MHKTPLKQPVLIYMYGLPGAGKTFVARQLAESLGLAHVSADRLRFELFEKPRHDKAEIQLVGSLMNFMTEQFLNAGVGVVYDMSVSRMSDRRALRDIARKHKVNDLMLWVQVDAETAKMRSSNRDKRKADDKYSENLDQTAFDLYMRAMQNPNNENYLVLSGKHLFNSHKAAILRRLNDMGIAPATVDHKIAKPEMVNLVSQAQAQAGRVDLSRRNVVIR